MKHEKGRIRMTSSFPSVPESEVFESAGELSSVELSVVVDAEPESQSGLEVESHGFVCAGLVSSASPHDTLSRDVKHKIKNL